jgi:hypothetical protein
MAFVMDGNVHGAITADEEGLRLQQKHETMGQPCV